MHSPSQKQILIINGNPDSQSFSDAICKAYLNGAQSSGHKVVLLNLRDLEFDPILHNGYRVPQPLENDLVQAQQKIKDCDHLVLVYPLWWGGLPALLKGFIDRTFLPGFAFKYHKDDPLWDKLLAGKSAHMIVTSDAPQVFNWILYLDSANRAIRKMILKFSGFSPIKTTALGNIKASTPQQRATMLEKVQNFGSAAK